MSLRGIEGLASGIVVAVCLEHSTEVAFGVHHPNLLPSFYRWGSSSPHQHFSAFGAVVTLWVACSWVCSPIFMGGFDVVVVVGISQSFLNSKRFPDIIPALNAMGCQCKSWDIFKWWEVFL